MERLVDALLSLSGPVAYALVGGLAFTEAAAFIGLVVPGELAVVLGGVLAAEGRVDLGLMMVVASIAAVTGDSVGYELGRRYGRRILDRPRVRTHVGPRLDRAEDVLHRYGGRAILLSRWTSVLRALVPSVAGMVRMPYGRFLVFNLLGGVSWAVAFVGLGYVAGASWRRVEAVAGPASALLLVLLVLLWALRVAARRLSAHADQVRGQLARLADTPVLRGARARFAVPLAWVARRFTPGAARGLGWTLSLVCAGGAAWVLGVAVQSLLAHEALALVDRPVAHWVAARTTSEATTVARAIVAWTSPPRGAWAVAAVTGIAWWGAGRSAAAHVVVAAGLTALLGSGLQMLLPASAVGTRFPAVSVAWLAAAGAAAVTGLAVHRLALAIRLAAAVAAVVLVVAAAELVAAGTAVSGIVGGLAIGVLIAAGGDLTARTVAGSRIHAPTAL